MRCWNCRTKIPDDARMCWHCEVRIAEGPSEEEIQAVREILAEMPSDVLEQLQATARDCKDADEFFQRIFVGSCPRCGSPETSDCDADPEINDPLVGRCCRCGQLWCLDCGELFRKGDTTCPRCVD